jgi:hypothetical protein
VRAFQAVNDGLMRAKRQHNLSELVRQSGDIPFDYAIICCAMRNFGRGMSAYYDGCSTCFPAAHKEVVAIASLEAVRAAVAARERHGIPVMGFDLAGEESGYPAGHHYAAYEEAHRHFLRKTVHAGEAYGPESIYEAIARCHAERLGHGTFLFSPDKIQDPQIVDKAGFADQLAEYNRDHARDDRSLPHQQPADDSRAGGDLRNHPVKRMLDYGMAVAVGTDNTLVSHTNINRELELVTDACKLDWRASSGWFWRGSKARSFQGATRRSGRSCGRRRSGSSASSSAWAPARKAEVPDAFPDSRADAGGGQRGGRGKEGARGILMKPRGSCPRSAVETLASLRGVRRRAGGGHGNNGGDACVAARFLHEDGIHVRVIMTCVPPC